ncbi:MAG: hypothetical protein HDR02_01800 [Lachnospiraceae bacterium]|nr:hypothetical protein [Lachnospiraceae bacterium]
MWKMMKRVVVAAGLCLFIGLQSLGSVQAAVNYEACPFCGTKVERYTLTNLVQSDKAGLCSEHSNCTLYNNLYNKYNVVECHTAGCPIYHESEHEYYVIVVHDRGSGK